MVYGNFGSDRGLSLAWPPKAVDLINESVEPPGEPPLFPSPILYESIIAERPDPFLVQDTADLFVEIDEGYSMRVLRPNVPGTPRDARSLVRSLNAAGVSRKDLAVVAYAGKFIKEIPRTELDEWIATLKSAGFRQIIIQQHGNFISQEPLREWPVPPREIAGPRSAAPYTFGRDGP